MVVLQSRNKLISPLDLSTTLGTFHCLLINTTKIHSLESYKLCPYEAVSPKAAQLKDRQRKKEKRKKAQLPRDLNPRLLEKDARAKIAAL